MRLDFHRKMCRIYFPPIAIQNGVHDIFFISVAAYIASITCISKVNSMKLIFFYRGVEYGAM